MLQQTQAARVEPVFRAFVDRFPSPSALATATRADALRAWAGLGYNRRAVRLHDAARSIVLDHGGLVPGEVGSLRSLPGVGSYTAAAVASIAFGVPVAAVDTNARRVVARVIRGIDPGELSPAVLSADAEALLDRRDPGRWNQALMDLGRDHCRPRPRCEGCPLRRVCRFAATGRPPHRADRTQSPFEGSSRQARGKVVALLRGRGSATISQVIELTGLPADRAASAVGALAADGVLEYTRAGRVRLPS